MASDPFHDLTRLQRELGAIAIELTRTHFVQFVHQPGWRPAVNVYRCENRYIICVDLAGIDREAIQVHAEPRRVRISGARPALEPMCGEGPQPAQVLAMEIDHGPFERVVDLPEEIDSSRVVAEHRVGLLWIKLPLRAHA